MAQKSFITRNFNQFRSLRFTHRCLCAQVSSNSNNDSLPDWLIEFNANITRNPKIVFPIFFTMRAATWYILANSCSSFLDFGPELAIGYVVAKLTAKFRQPVNIALASVLIRLFPTLQKMNVTPLLIIVPKSSKKDPNTEKDESSFEKVINVLEGPINKYGVGLVISGRINSVLTIVSISYLTHYGVDLNSFFDSIGISQSLQETSGTLAGASLLNTFLLPVHVWYTTKIAGRYQIHRK